MANKWLFISSSICSTVIVLFFLYHHKCSLNNTYILVPFVILGLITSLFNHGSSNNKFLSILDRFVIVIGTLILIYILLKRIMMTNYNFKDMICLFGVGVGIFLFFLSKFLYDYSDQLHISSHVIATLTIIYLVYTDIYLFSM